MLKMILKFILKWISNINLTKVLNINYVNNVINMYTPIFVIQIIYLKKKTLTYNKINTRIKHTKKK